MALNKNELILDRIRMVTAHDLADSKMILRLTSVEDPSINCSAEGEEVTDAVGALITTMYRAKRATFSGSNSLHSFDLLANQYGTKKEVASSSAAILDYTYDILDVASGTESVKLTHTPKNKDEIKYIYSLVDGDIGTTFTAGSVASATDFVIGDEGTITVPTGFTGKLFVEYTYDSQSAMAVANKASNFPEAVGLIIYAYFRDKCNENVKYSGKIICPKAKINPESLELALTSAGKHPFEFTMMKDYCAEEGDDELFRIIVSE